MDKVCNEVNRLASMLEHLEPGPEYDETVTRIKNLLELEFQAKKVNELILPNEISILEKILNNGPLLNLIGGVAGTLLVINHERLNILTTRAFSFIRFK